ncbi:LacI family DNA-binding transcriptional regulator [Brevibacterium sp. Marseille-P9724]|uniref:LacI family DNA-binding transcriptional regulator n=1 Tax=Brevibacterium sp. Marseille-P9724 TaxID=2614125 RepID=UPI00125EE788|nr:LacI family DNA-binding transcriptional regulator [Brevibacterium sp. Marseille-P9724]
MNKRRRPPTIRDVAAAAGVSPSTVSHAFSGRRTISKSTQKRVVEAAENLGYHPNPHARSMRTGRTEMIGLILRPHVSRSGSLQTHETFNRLAGAVAVACIREGMGLVHIPASGDAPLTVLPMDGCIVAYPHADDPVLDELQRRGVPVVCADPDPARPDICPWAGVDYDTGINQVLDAIAVDPGDDVWLMVGTEDNAWKRSSESRLHEWARTKDLSLRVHRTTGEAWPSDVRQQLLDLLQHHATPRAIVYARSDLTEPVVSAIGAAGLRVPRDVQLATLTDSAHTRIPLTSVTALDLNQEALALAAVTQMLRVLEDPAAHPDPVLVSPQLGVRASTRSTPPLPH